MKESVFTSKCTNRLDAKSCVCYSLIFANNVINNNNKCLYKLNSEEFFLLYLEFQMTSIPNTAREACVDIDFRRSLHFGRLFLF